MPKTQSARINSIPEQEDFKVKTHRNNLIKGANRLQIASSISDFYRADFRLREFIVKCLKSIAMKSANPATQHTHPLNAALQLAVSHSIDFETMRDDGQATFFLKEHSLKYADLQNQIQQIYDDIQESSYQSSLFLMLIRQGYIQDIDFSQHYREKILLERAEISYEREIQSLQLVFGQSHNLCLKLRATLARIKEDQKR